MKALFAFLLAFALAFGQVIDPTLPIQPPAEPTPAPLPEPPVETVPVPLPQPPVETIPVPIPAPEPETIFETIIQTIVETIAVPLPEPTLETIPVPVETIPIPEPIPSPEPEPVEFVCDSNACCLANAGEGGIYSLRFTERCLDGGLHCVQDSGCEVCRRDDFTPEQEIEFSSEDDDELIMRPQCEGPITCDTQECCDDFEIQAGVSLRVQERCLRGGNFCYELTGCQFCSDEPQELEEGVLPLPFCDPSNDEACFTQECCNELANPNSATGSGYLVFNPLCADEETLTEDCQGVSGCQLCFNAPAEGLERNLGDRPPCPADLFI